MPPCHGGDRGFESPPGRQNPLPLPPLPLSGRGGSCPSPPAPSPTSGERGVVVVPFPLPGGRAREGGLRLTTGVGYRQWFTINMPDADDFVSLFRSHGLRITPQRHQVFR